MTNEEYRKAFGELPKEAKELAFRTALDSLNREIDLYWKRATYFWAFIAFSLVGYVTLLTSPNLQSSSQRGEALLAASCLGVVFSTAWYFINRSSKFWQRNWEKHVELLEDDIIGPLHKTFMSSHGDSFWRFWTPYHFSGAKINQILSLFVVLLFLLIAAATAWEYFCVSRVFSIAIIALTLGALSVLFLFGRSVTGTREDSIRATERTTKVV